MKEVIEKSYAFGAYQAMSDEAIQSARLYENEYVINKQREIYKKILENKI